jgi:MoaA/NifB/PqqE/SkfB family radical SAM enzyme
MGGVVIGSTMEQVFLGQRWLALMINTGCNLNCPMCYLGKKESNENMKLKVAEKLANMADDGIAIIGTEPLLNEDSVEIVEFFSSVKRTHLLTNGVNLEKFAGKLRRVERIDVSMDGGPKTYCRSESFAAIHRGVQKWRELSGGKVYMLITLSKQNILNIADILEGSRILEAERALFSPYVKTLGGNNGVTPVTTEEIVRALIPFAGENWKLMIDPYHAIFEWREWEKIKRDMDALPEKNQLIIDFDPGERIRRIGIDGKEKHPFMALHPGIKFQERT